MRTSYIPCWLYFPSQNPLLNKTSPLSPEQLPSKQLLCDVESAWPRKTPRPCWDSINLRLPQTYWDTQR
jgi:hypothetical protein